MVWMGAHLSICGNIDRSGRLISSLLFMSLFGQSVSCSFELRKVVKIATNSYLC